MSGFLGLRLRRRNRRDGMLERTAADVFKLQGMHRGMRFRRNRPEQLLVQRRPEMPVRRPLDKTRLETKEKSDEEIKLTDEDLSIE